MTEKFDSKKYIEQNNKISLLQEQKDKIIENISLYKSLPPDYQSSRTKGDLFFNVWIRAVAVVLMLLIIGSIAYFVPKSTNSKAENSFFLTANAAEYDGLGEDIIGLFSVEQGNSFGFFNPDYESESYTHNGRYFNKMGKIDHFYCYNFSCITVNGKNIKSIEFSSNIKGLYFVFSRPENSNLYEYGGFNNSQYTQAEFDEYGDGLYGKFCDSFIYNCNFNQSEQHKCVISDNPLSLIVETDRANPVVDKTMEEYLSLNEKQLVLKAENHRKNGENGKISSEQELIDKKLDDCNAVILSEMLKNAFIDVKVSFVDGSTQSYKLKVECVCRADILDNKPMIEVSLAD